LSEVAGAALAGGASRGKGAEHEPTVPLPVHTRKFLENLPRLSPEAIAVSLKALLQRASEVSRARRVAIVVGCIVFPLMSSVGGFFGMHMLERLEKESPGLLELNTLLSARTWANRAPSSRQSHFPDDRLVALYIAQHYRTTVTNDAWMGAMSQVLIKGDARTFAERSVADHPTLTATEVEEADAALEKVVPKGGPFAGGRLPNWFWLAMFGVSLLFYVAAPALIAALLFRGGLVLLIAGVTFVRGDGSRAGRMRVFWRAIVTWCPVALAGILYGIVHHIAGVAVAAVAAGLFLATLVALSLALPNRGLQDRLAGTWPVPR
jgi:hypothetical protein